MSFLSVTRAAGSWWGRILASRWTGWGFFIGLGLLSGAWMRYDYVVEQWEACKNSAPTKVETKFAEDLKGKNNATLEERLKDLAVYDDSCLDSVYDPDQAARDRTVREAGETE